MLKSNKTASIISAILGIIIVILGIVLLSSKVPSSKAVPASFSHDYRWADVSHASFGADFYTYMYDASYEIARGISSVDGGIEDIISAQNNQIKAQNAQVKAQQETTKAINRAAGFIVITIGLSLIAFSLFNRNGIVANVGAAQEPIQSFHEDDNSPSSNQIETSCDTETPQE